MNQLLETTRQFIRAAISTGRSYQSPQTGYFHFCYEKGDEEQQDSIPLKENFLFAMALLRTRNKYNMDEGRKILNNLLSFQRPDGNFPIYLHDFPKCKDPYMGAQLLVPFYWILKVDAAELDGNLKSKLEGASRTLLKLS